MTFSGPPLIRPSATRAHGMTTDSMNAVISRSLRLSPPGEMASSDANRTGAGDDDWSPTVTANTAMTAATNAATASRAPLAVRRFPGERRVNRRRVQRCLRIPGEELDERRELRAVPDVVERHRRAPRVASVHDDGRRADQPVEARSPVLDFTDVLQRDFRHASAARREHAEVGQRVGDSRRHERTRLPQDSFPRQRRVHGRQGCVKVTFGTCCASGGASKNGYSLKPKRRAVTLAGNCRRDVLYA